MKRRESLNLTRDQRVEILHLLRESRALVLRDYESFHSAALVLEHIGQIVGGKIENGFHAYNNALLNLADEASDHDARDVGMLFETVRLAKNDVVHGSAYVRHLSDRLVELFAVLESAVMSTFLLVKDTMVRDVAVANDCASPASDA
jgi:hypothetical protein